MLHSSESPKQIRKRHKLSQTAAAAKAGMAPNTYRVYEADRFAVGEENRAKGDAFIASLVSSEPVAA